MKTTKSNNAVKVSEEVMRLRKELNLKADAIVDNGYCVWVTAPEKGAVSDKLKAEGFAFSPKRGAWWRRSENADAPAKTAPKTAPKGQKPQTKKASQPKAEKTEKPQAELTAEQKALADKYARMFPQAQVSVDRTWVWLKCEKDYGKTNSESLKAEGFWFSQKREAWYRTPEHAQMAQAQKPAQKTAPKAEPKKAQPKAKTATKKGGVVRLAEMYA